MKYYAHSTEDAEKSSWQLLKDHLHETATQAANFAQGFNTEKLGYVVGLMHDIGKYSKEFQRRLEGSKKKVDHSTAGAQELYKKFGRKIGKAMAYVVAGHHGGLPDGNKGDPSNLPERIFKPDIPDYKAFANEIEMPTIANEDLLKMPRAAEGMEAFSFAFCIRMLYSCLVDADFLNTESFMNFEKHSNRPKDVSMKTLLNRFEGKLGELAEKNRTNFSVINSARQSILERCLAMSLSNPGIYSLTVPTGGGKTYSSLAFGLKHAVTFGKDRIIYVIPYTSIIEQNAQVFRDALGDDNIVLEHHSSFEYPEGNVNEWDNCEKSHRLASENWDMPVVVTTSVQFFESLYANKGSRCRKLHNMVNSVIILDEAQMMPLEFMKPCLWALAELVINYKATVVLCTATQPAIKELIPGGLIPIEIMEKPKELQKTFKRVSVNYGYGLTDDELAVDMAKVPQVLTIVNTRKHARLLFDKLLENSEQDVFHLSARMCPAHRKEILAEIRQRLKDGRNCRVVSTQLIEAGVDVDFPIVYRSAAGLDSIAQAAGRCNREGKLLEGNVIVFEPEPHGMPKKGRFDAAAGMTRSTVRRLSEFNNDLLSLEAIEDYFKQLLDLEADVLDSYQILRTIKDGAEDLAFPFGKIAKEFQLIDSPMSPIIVPWDNKAMRIMGEAEHSQLPASKTRSLQPYVVQVYQHEMVGLEREGVIKLVGGVLKILTDKSFYDKQFGMKDAKGVKAPDEILLF